VKGQGTRAKLKMTESLTGVVVSERLLVASEEKPVEIPLPWPALSAKKLPPLDLVIEAHATNSEKLFLSVTPLLNRQDLIKLCRGVGVEIGPGVNPQVLTGFGVDVIYCDEMDRDEWERTYAYKKHTWAARADSTPWHLYRRASADELPVADESLDFIFASHVFEHLVNPLGHLEHWLSKLRPGGLIAAIVPNAESSVDYSRALSTLPEIIAQVGGPMRPGREHYARFFGEKEADRRLSEKRSFHAHFYTPENLGALLSHAVRHNGLAWYQIQHRGNYQEIFFVGGKAEPAGQA
jgi:SAM-dependent methyltransferase